MGDISHKLELSPQLGDYDKDIFKVCIYYPGKYILRTI